MHLHPSAKTQPQPDNALPGAFLKLALCAVSAAALLVPTPASAESESDSPERRFGFTHPALTQPVGEIELETRGTWKHRTGELRAFEFSHEFEIGLTRQTQLGLSVASWSLDARTGEKRFSDAALEVIHNFTNPLTSAIGSAVSAEVAIGERSTALETKLILEKRLGAWTLGWNGSLEATWDGERVGDLQESAGELSQSVGIAYDVLPGLSLGVEALHVLPLEKWHAPSQSELYAGPSMTYRQKHFRATLAALFQTTERTEEPALQLRTIFGIEF
jgi:hypothetical protein